MARRVIARFVGTNREFKKYLETLRASEVVSLDGHCVEGNDYWRSFKAKEDDECEDYERRAEDAQTQEAENANAGNN